MNKIESLTEFFQKFPGIGVRQAKRFAYHVLSMNPADAGELARLIEQVRSQVLQCPSCQRYFEQQHDSQNLCAICNSSNRDHNKLMVVAHDSDVTAIERSSVYDGLYFVLGGTVPLLHSESIQKIRGGTLRATVEARLPVGLTEVILAFAVNPDGENTTRFVESIINQIDGDKRANLTISQLGRGLSTGSELEYADPDTIKNALKNRG